MVSDDSILIPGAIMEGYRCMEAGPEDVAACAFAFRDYPSEQEYKVGYTLGGKLFVNHGMYRRSALEAVGWIEEDLYRFYHADGDLCLKMWEKGYKVLPCEAAKLEHIIDPRGALRRSNYQAAAQNNDWEHYIKRWDGLFYFLNAPVTGGWIRVASVTDSCYAKRLAHRMPLSFKLAYGVQRYGRQLMSLAHKIFFKK